MKNRIILTLFVLYTLVINTECAYAQITPDQKPSKFHWSVYTQMGMGKVSLPSDSQSPSMGFTNLGTTIAPMFLKGKVGLGLSLDYRFITQFSEVVTTVGNRRGSYMNLVAPTLVLNFKKFRFKIAYHMMGTYSLLNTTLAGESISYSKPSGLHAEMGVALSKSNKFYVTGSMESISFSTKNLDGNSSTLAEPISLNQYAIGIMYVF